MKSNSTRSRPNQQILEEASSWFVDFRAGDIDARAREEFHAWLRRSPEHIQAYMDIAGTYAEIPAPGGEPQLDVEALVARARSAPEANVFHLGRWSTQSASPRPMRRYALAATVLLAMASFATWFQVQRGTYATGIGEHRSIVLEDGSTVQLNSDSRIRVRYTDAQRHIELLEGQALFEVAKDAQHPFIVQTDRTRVRAVGTQFDVYRKSGGTVVTVVEGRVAIQSSSKPAQASQPNEILLAAGEQIIVKPASVERPAHTSIASATAWTARQLIFDATPLSEVAEEFNRYTARRLVIEGPGLDDFHISGTYSSTNPESLLRFLRAQPGLELTETDREIRVTSK
jgi:transmembrane sensor